MSLTDWKIAQKSCQDFRSSAIQIVSHSRFKIFGAEGEQCAECQISRKGFRYKILIPNQFFEKKKRLEMKVEIIQHHM